MRRALLATQVKTGCEGGSWFSDEATEIWTLQGGRLLSTSLAALTLTTSYRHLRMHEDILPPVHFAKRNNSAITPGHQR